MPPVGRTSHIHRPLLCKLCSQLKWLQPIPGENREGWGFVTRLGVADRDHKKKEEEEGGERRKGARENRRSPLEVMDQGHVA